MILILSLNIYNFHHWTEPPAGVETKQFDKEETKRTELQFGSDCDLQQLQRQTVCCLLCQQFKLVQGAKGKSPWCKCLHHYS